MFSRNLIDLLLLFTSNTILKNLDFLRNGNSTLPSIEYSENLSFKTILPLLLSSSYHKIASQCSQMQINLLKFHEIAKQWIPNPNKLFINYITKELKKNLIKYKHATIIHTFILRIGTWGYNPMTRITNTIVRN